MSSDSKKPKRKPTTFKKMFKEEEKIIERLDPQSYYVKGAATEPYLVYNSNGKGWLCDCMYFTLNINDNGDTKECKHIKIVRDTYDLK